MIHGGQTVIQVCAKIANNMNLLIHTNLKAMQGRLRLKSYRSPWVTKELLLEKFEINTK